MCLPPASGSSSEGRTSAPGTAAAETSSETTAATSASGYIYRMLAARDDKGNVEGVAAFTAAIGAQSLSRGCVGSGDEDLFTRSVCTAFAAFGAAFDGCPIEDEGDQYEEAREDPDDAHDFSVSQLVFAVLAPVGDRADG